MNFSDIYDHCIQKKGAQETFPFGEQILVFKVGNKMFALIDVDNSNSVNLKCEPEKAIQLREQYQGVLPGYHMSKVHWNTVLLKEDVPDSLIKSLMDHSYDLIYNSLSKKVKQEIE